ncbi:MAG: hypothetical protein MUO17_05740 [Dehalococcoidales bacterium]|nr:hypothetical protein [Dehalococcoidales bacterium]
MAKEIILYNLAENITDEEYKKFVTNEKGPLLESLSSVKKFELVKITGAATGEIPFKYVGILHLKSLEEFYQKDAPSQKFQDFLKKWQPMTSDFHILFGEEIY